MSELKRRSAGEQPQWHTHGLDANDGYWTVPEGYKHPSCPICGHKYWLRKPERSIGGASVRGPLCKACERDVQRMGEGKYE